MKHASLLILLCVAIITSCQHAPNRADASKRNLEREVYKTVGSKRHSFGDRC